MSAGANAPDADAGDEGAEGALAGEPTPVPFVEIGVSGGDFALRGSDFASADKCVLSNESTRLSVCVSVDERRQHALLSGQHALLSGQHALLSREPKYAESGPKKEK